jgi:CBS domain-containing protein
MKATVAEILEKKGRKVWTVASEQTVYEALELMAQKNIGAVLVMEADRVVGIFSERDYARKGILKGRTSQNTGVSEIMTRDVYCVPPWQTIEKCMGLMTDKRLRHLPVIDQGKLIGIVSIGDVVKEVISEKEFAIQELEMYVDDVLKSRNSSKSE